MNKTWSREKYRQSQNVDRVENQCRKSQDMGGRCSERTKKHSRNGVRLSSQMISLDLSATTKRVSQKPTSVDKFLMLNIMEITHMENIKW